MPEESPHWRLKNDPREWQTAALEKWLSGHKGVASVVTGGGKTIFAFLCMDEFHRKHPDGRYIILVPTITLLDQWYVSLQEDFGVTEAEIACFSSQEKASKPAKINLLVINTGRTMVKKMSQGPPCFLIVDECHRAGSPENAKALTGTFAAALGLSATPEREYDEGFQKYVVPALGPVIFEYDYVQAFEDKVITPFDLINVKIDFLPHEREEYDKLTKRAAVLFKKAKSDPEAENKLKYVLQKRAGVSAQAKMRIPVAAKIADENRGMHTIIFHERVASANTLYAILKKRNHSVCLYHSKIAPNWRRDNLRLFRQGVFDVLVSCRALDEGMNVPETAVAVIASSTASQRQRIQRLGRVLRPARGKNKATIYTLFATEQEQIRLTGEAAKLEGVANILWATGTREEPHG
ncbi:MAG TPA: DEAD/DEAH box helicase [Bryobacteraceae bacterium]|nr:DEAD/DEAH box helicase [Bryobacteraceae bacterium]